MTTRKAGVVKVPAGVDGRFHAVLYHEAGHVVMAWLLGRKLKSATVAASTDRGGNVTVGDWRRGHAPVRAKRETAIWYSELVISLAGEAAEIHAMGRAPLWSYASDFGYAVEIAHRFCPGDYKAVRTLLSDASKFATESLAANWKAVELTAFQLFLGETRGDAFMALLDKWCDELAARPVAGQSATPPSLKLAA